MRTLRICQTLRIVDAVPLWELRLSRRAAVRQAWCEAYTEVVQQTCQTCLPEWDRADQGKLTEAVTGLLSAGTADTFEAILDDHRPIGAPDRRAESRVWSGLMERLQSVWRSNSRPAAFVALRDPAALRRLAFGDGEEILRVIGARARHLTPNKSAALDWKDLAKRASEPSLISLVSTAREFFGSTVARWKTAPFWFSHELVISSRSE